MGGGGAGDYVFFSFFRSGVIPGFYVVRDACTVKWVVDDDDDFVKHDTTLPVDNDNLLLAGDRDTINVRRRCPA